MYLVWLEVFLNIIDKTHPGAKDLLKKKGWHCSCAIVNNGFPRCSR